MFQDSGIGTATPTALLSSTMTAPPSTSKKKKKFKIKKLFKKSEKEGKEVKRSHSLNGHNHHHHHNAHQSLPINGRHSTHEGMLLLGLFLSSPSSLPLLPLPPHLLPLPSPSSLPLTPSLSLFPSLPL